MMEMTKQHKSHKNRYKKKRNRLTIADFYDPKFGLSPTEWVGFFKDFFHDLSKEIIREGYYWKVPKSKGEIRIKKVKKSDKKFKSGVDWKATKEHHKDGGKGWIFHKNFHTAKNHFRWFWDKFPCNPWINRRFYSFRPVRCGNPGQECGQRGLARWINTCADPDSPYREFDAEL
jgi:hypothetical protein